MWKFSSALRQKSHLHYTTEEERQAIKKRFRNEGLDENMPDDKKLPHVWRWLCDAEVNWMSMKKQNEKLYKQQEADLKEVEEYIENLWRQSNNRLVELQTENRMLKQEIYSLKLSKPTDSQVLDIVNNNNKNLLLNTKAENGDLNTQQLNDLQKENKKSAFSNVKQMFIKNNNANNKQLNLENELRFLIDKCRSIENEKKRLEVENENLCFKLNETLNICDKLESSKTSVQLARNSKSFYELRQTTSDYRLNKVGQDKLTTSKTMNFQAINDDNKSTSGIDSSSSQDKENDLVKFAKNDDRSRQANNLDKQKIKKSQLNQHDSGRESSSTLTDARESKDFKNYKEFKETSGETNTGRILSAVQEECALLKKELIAKEKKLIIQEKKLSELQIKYTSVKARNREQILKLKTHIDRETKRWEKLFNSAKQKSNESDKNANLVDSL